MKQILDFGQEKQSDEIIVPGITAILFHPETRKIGCLHDANNPWDYWLISWGANGSEDFLECAKREIIEETGYNDFGIIQAIVPLFYSRYFHPKKNKNFRWEVRPYLVEVRSLNNIWSAPEEHEKWFEAVWVDADDIRQNLLYNWDQRFGKWWYTHWMFLLDEAEKMIVDLFK